MRPVEARSPWAPTSGPPISGRTVAGRARRVAARPSGGRSRPARTLLVGLAVLLFASEALSGPPTAAEGPTSTVARGLAEPLSTFRARDLERAARLLRRHVAEVEATMPKERYLSPMVVDGWGIVTGPREVRCQAFLVKGAVQVRVTGPEGTVVAEVVALDVELRVARLRSAEPVSAIGLVPASPSPPEERQRDMELLALVSTLPGAGVVVGTLIELGEAPHLEGNLRSTLELARGMPVFDLRLRWVGLARVVAWDEDPAMLIPPELTRIPARSSTTASAPRSAPPPDAGPSRPWWAP